MAMGMKSYLIFILGILCLMTGGYLQFVKYFDNKDIYLQKISHLEKMVQQKEMMAQVQQSQLIMFQREVASLIPEALNKNAPFSQKYPLRNLASVVSHETNDELELQRIRQIFEKSKKEFEARHYRTAAQGLEKFIQINPYSPQIVEAHYLLVESYFQLKKNEKCILAIENMIHLFPGNDLTGFSLIRLGKVYEAMNQPDQAIDVYKTIIKSFSNQKISGEAVHALKSVEL